MAKRYKKAAILLSGSFHWTILRGIFGTITAYGLPHFSSYSRKECKLASLVKGVRYCPLCGYPGLNRPLQHDLGQFYLVLEDDLFREANLLSKERIILPSLWQVECPVDKGCALVGGVGKEYPNLAVDRVPS